ncbi:MAG: hypothetical protein HFF48_07480 [Lawsonibacter sp.]|nr:hypothetical protein [Lawsonibacter sp.]
MTPTYDQMGDWLEEIAARFPEAFFEDLDGGIQLEEHNCSSLSLLPACFFSCE